MITSIDWNRSALIVSEFGERIARDDALCDVVTRERFVVGERGFTPRVSEQTADRLAGSSPPPFAIAPPFPIPDAPRGQRR